MKLDLDAIEARCKKIISSPFNDDNERVSLDDLAWAWDTHHLVQELREARGLLERALRVGNCATVNSDILRFLMEDK